MRDAPWTCPRSHSRSCNRSCSGSHLQSCSLDRWPRSPSRSWQGRRVTFWELEVELEPKEGWEYYPPDPSILDVKTWLDWQASQLDMPCWWTELRAIPGVEDPWKLTWKIWASFSIPEVRSRVFLGQDYTAPPTPKCNTQNMFLPNELSYQDVWQQPFLCCLCLRIAVLGRETQSAREPRFPPIGKKCHRVEGKGERAHHVHQLGHFLGLRESQPGGYKPVAPNHLV